MLGVARRMTGIAHRGELVHMSAGTPMKVLILGAGFGGLELMTRLSESVSDKVQVTLIDKSDAFMFGFSKLDVLIGRRPASEL